MGLTLAIALLVVLAGLGWWVYVRSGARRWTAERDPLGEPPLRTAALIAAIVVAVAVASSGGGDATQHSAIQQAFDDGASVDGPEEAFAASRAERDLEADRRSAPVAATDASVAADSTAARDDGAPETRDPPVAPPAGNAARATPAADTRQAAERDLPAYGKLVVRARRAAKARGAEIGWYPAIADDARRASAARAR